MNSRERVHAAMRHEIPDRVPVMCQLALGHYFVNSDRNPADIWFDSETFATTLEEFRRRYRFDGLLINLPGRPANWRDYLASREAQQDSEILTWKQGGKTRVPSDDNPHTLLTNNRPLSRADYLNVDASDPAVYRMPGLVWNTWHAPTLWDIGADADLARPASYPEWFTLALRSARAFCPDVSVHVEVFSPFTYMMELFGYESALMALLDVPDTCHMLLSAFTGVAIAQVDRYASCEPDAILVSSAFAGAGFISRDMYRQFVLPYENQVASAIAAHRVSSYVHTCGAIGDRLDLMAETGIDGIDTLDPPPLGTVDLAAAKNAFGQRFFFKGNLDAVNEMLLANDASFEQAVKERIEIGMPGAGYILSSACSVAPHVRPDRLKRMVELAETFGKYG
jgi:uroporphyrinogen-III decarboxylase